MYSWYYTIVKVVHYWWLYLHHITCKWPMNIGDIVPKDFVGYSKGGIAAVRVVLEAKVYG